MDKQSECSNCHARTNGDFCHVCGQSTSIHRITFNETIGEFFSSTFSLEGPLLSTIRLLIVNPGLLFREFIGGKRKKYYKPVSFFVVITATYLILRALIGYDPLEGRMPQIDENAPDAVVRAKKAAYYMVANINNIMLFLVFAIGLNHKFFFWKRHNLAEYVTIGFYATGIYTIYGTLHMVFNAYVTSIPNQIALILLVIYLAYSAMSFHQTRSFLAIVKYLLLGLFSVVLYVIFGYGFSFLMVS